MKSYFIILLFLVVLAPLSLWAADSPLPPWTERSAWLEGSELRVTGVASRATSKELGRQASYQNGLKEIQNFFSSIGGSIPLVQTQMIYEKQNSDGTFDVYRLLKVDTGGSTRTLKINLIHVLDTEKVAPVPFAF